MIPFVIPRRLNLRWFNGVDKLTIYVHTTFPYRFESCICEYLLSLVHT